jgi:hypothetical protein
MNTISPEKGKTTFQVLFVVLLQLTTTNCQYILYNTDQTFKSSSLEYDCLNYHVYNEKLAYQGLSDVIDEVIPYCFRPENNFDRPLETFVDPLSQKLSFEQIRVANITALQLLSWSTPIEVAERYQIYLNELNPSLNEYFYNCTEGRFGLQCQYLFPFGEGMSFNEIVEAAFRGRIAYSESSDMIVQMPCYVLLKCHRNGQLWCLDWREICDGKIDCFDEGLDEEFCFDMEMNECREDEYRCHNGLCISEDLWEDGMGDTDCLDRSDTAVKIDYIDSCFQDPTFRCEEHSCRADSKPFSCGDGQCVSTFDKCYNGRHMLLIDSMIAKGNLTNECWIAMICLTKLVKKDNENLCETWLMNSTVYAALEQCESFFQFPTMPVYSDHVRFFYKAPHLRTNDGAFLLPDYLCYDQQLCDSIIPDLFHDNLTCLNKSKVIQIWITTENPWALLMSLIERYFRSCSIPRSISYNKTKYSDHPSLYNCRNSSKFISKHRIMDLIQDCFEYDDETYENSCLLNDRYRVKCSGTTKCWSPLVKNEACLLNDQGEIPFQSFCDGIKRYFYDNHGQEHSDEDGCGNWSCNNIYARCDGFWACSDGRDEDNCSRTICPSQTYPCISPVNYTMICLPSERVNDGTVDCLGALDEQSICRSIYPSGETSYSFHCSNYGLCLEVSQLCNKKDDCQNGEDEFCNSQQFTCDQDSAHNRSDVEEVFCALEETENHRTKHFSVHTSSNYPSLEKNTIAEFDHWPTERRPFKNVNVARVEDHLWPWYCNRGLIVHTQIENNSISRTCMCPPSYYGHLCQYQNQRISLTLRLTSNDRYATYAIVSMLIDDHDEKQEIDAYDQFVYIAKQTYSIKLNRYLLFPTRPKNVSKNYSVRIDVYEKNAITYVGSWHFPVAFLFLPVNRLSVSLNLSNHLLQRSSNCSVTCKNGECLKYVNKDNYFCRCYPGWSGIQCNIPTDCQTCSFDSTCIGSANNKSICVCPIDRFGPRCLLRSTCPINACQNNGQCVPADVTIPGSSYSCICSDRFFGQNCEHRKATLDVSFTGIDIPTYLVAYFFTLSNKSEPIETIILQKLTPFQHSVIFHVAVPFHLTFIQASDKYYLAVLQQSPKTGISTSISPRQECIPVEKLLNSSVLEMVPYQRIIYFHILCQTNVTLTCFIDEAYLCLCTNDHHANCLKFNRQRNFQPPLNNSCANGGHCLPDHSTIPPAKNCLCPSCFFGNKCQFYAKGFGSTLDEILGYEFKRNTLLSKQPIAVKVSAIVTMLLFGIGIINSILAIITFSRKKSQEVGCGIYLLGSSITSLITIILFTLKFWLLFFSNQDYYGQHNQQRIFRGNCYIEPALKVFLYLNNWLNACVAIERAMSVLQGVTFNKNRSKRVARWITLLLFSIIVCLFITQLIHLHIFDDETEERSWCVVKYTPWLQIYSTTFIFFHYFAPLSINIFSLIFVIITIALQRARTQNDRSFWVYLKLRVKEQKHILMSSAIIVCLTLPYLITTIILDCKKSSRLLWFHLIGYFLSFFPAALVFMIFVLPSSLYKQEFKQLIARIHRRLIYSN